MRIAIYRAVTVAGAVCVLLVSLEFGLRIYDYARGRPSPGRAYWYWMYQQDPLMGYRGRPNVEWKASGGTIQHNADGFRDHRTFSEIEKMNNKRLVICVGESSTYGLTATSNDSTYPVILERQLRLLTKDSRWIVLNAGMPGYTSHEVLQLIKLRLLKLQPEMIVMMNLRNDHEFVGLYLDNEQDYNFYPVRLAQLSATLPNELLMRSSLYALAATRLRGCYTDDFGGRPPGRTHEGVTERGLKLYQDNLILTHVLCARSGVRLLCVDQPVNYLSYDKTKRSSMEGMRNAMRKLCEEEGIVLLEANSIIDWNTIKPEDDVHLGDKGYEKLAEILAAQIVKLM